MFRDAYFHVKLCIVHIVRNSTKYVSYKDLKQVTADLKRIYTVATEELALQELQEFAEQWDLKYPVFSDLLFQIESFLL